jgi:hypothetical protein
MQIPAVKPEGNLSVCTERHGILGADANVSVRGRICLIGEIGESVDIAQTISASRLHVFNGLWLASALLLFG